MEDAWHDEGTLRVLIREFRSDDKLWEMLVDRFREAEEIEKLGREIGKRFDLEPEFFPERKKPIAPEIARIFLKKKFGKNFSVLNSQLVMAARQSLTLN